MKELVAFSLKRRFRNRSTIMFNIIIAVIAGVICFSPEILRVVYPSLFVKQAIYTKGISQDERNYLNSLVEDHYEFRSTKKPIKEHTSVGEEVLEYKDHYTLHSKYQVEEGRIALFRMHLSQYQRNVLMQQSQNPELLEKYEQEAVIKNKVLIQNIDLSSEKRSLIFMATTSIYFMMLSFVSAVASEVVNEKTTKTLELILTSVRAKTHFLSKMLAGWLVVVIQACLSGGCILFWFLIRFLYDQGVGILSLLRTLHIAQIEEKNFYAMLSNMGLNGALLLKIIFIALFLMIGILLIQLILVIISSFISTIEEASNIQAPFYLLLLGVYYLALALNTPEALSEGIGFYLSFVPFVSMLFMPCRLLIQNVSLVEMALSFLFTFVLIVLVVLKGSKIYERGILDYSCKGFVDVLRKLRKVK